jgi:hypothetical protein
MASLIHRPRPRPRPHSHPLTLLSGPLVYPQVIETITPHGYVRITHYSEDMRKRIQDATPMEYDQYEYEDKHGHKCEYDCKHEKKEPEGEKFVLEYDNGSKGDSIDNIMISLRINEIDSIESIKSIASLIDILLRIRIYPVQYILEDFRIFSEKISNEEKKDGTPYQKLYFYFKCYAILREMDERLRYFFNRPKLYERYVPTIRDSGLHTMLNEKSTSIGSLGRNIKDVSISTRERIIYLLHNLIYEIGKYDTFIEYLQNSVSLLGEEYFHGEDLDSDSDFRPFSKRSTKKSPVAKRKAKRSSKKSPVAKQKAKCSPKQKAKCSPKQKVKRSTKQKVKRSTKHM